MQGSIYIRCDIRQFLASHDLIVDMIFEWLEFLVEEFLVEVLTEKTENAKPKKYHKKPKITEKNEGCSKFQIWDWFLSFFFFFFWLQPPRGDSAK